MKWMGWGWRQYLETPTDVVVRVLELIGEEQAAIERARTTRRR